MSNARERFEDLTADWGSADQECTRTYLAWQAACRNRERLAIEKNNAWGDLIMEEVAENSAVNPRAP